MDPVSPPPVSLCINFTALRKAFKKQKIRLRMRLTPNSAVYIENIFVGSRLTTHHLYIVSSSGLIQLRGLVPILGQ